MPNNAARFGPAVSITARIVHMLVEVRDSRHSVRKAGAPLVETDQPENLPGRANKCWIARSFPLHIGIGHEAWNEDQVNGPLSETW